MVGEALVEQFQPGEVADAFVATCPHACDGVGEGIAHVAQAQARGALFVLPAGTVDRRDDHDGRGGVIFTDDLHEPDRAGREGSFVQRPPAMDVDAKLQRDQIGGTVAYDPRHHGIEVALPAEAQAGEVQVVFPGRSGGPGTRRAVRRAAVRNRTAIRRPSLPSIRRGPGLGAFFQQQVTDPHPIPLGQVEFQDVLSPGDAVRQRGEADLGLVLRERDGLDPFVVEDQVEVPLLGRFRGDGQPDVPRPRRYPDANPRRGTCRFDQCVMEERREVAGNPPGTDPSRTVLQRNCALKKVIGQINVAVHGIVPSDPHETLAWPSRPCV